MKKFQNLTLSLIILLLVSCGSANNISQVNRDGSSFEKAIIVNSVAAEYEYIRKVCTGCQLISQSLTTSNGKPHDVIRVKKPNGESISYYFDISKFF